MFASDVIYSDNDIRAIEALPLNAWHRKVDVEIVNADTDGSYYLHICIDKVQFMLPHHYRLCENIHHFTFDDLWHGYW